MLRRLYTTAAFKDRLKAELKTALLSKNTSHLSVLKNIQAEVINFEKKGKQEEVPSNAAYLMAMQGLKDRYIKTIDSYAKLISQSGKAEDASKLQILSAKESTELATLQSLLPSPYTPEELRQMLPEQVETFSQAINALKNQVDYTRISRASLANMLQSMFPRK